MVRWLIAVAGKEAGGTLRDISWLVSLASNHLEHPKIISQWPAGDKSGHQTILRPSTKGCFACDEEPNLQNDPLRI
jgi:hypothetical protein